jgi:hypothetical protein
VFEILAASLNKPYIGKGVELQFERTSGSDFEEAFYIFRLRTIMYASNLAQDRDRWWSLVNAVVNRQVPKNVGSILTS